MGTQREHYRRFDDKVDDDLGKFTELWIATMLWHHGVIKFDNCAGLSAFLLLLTLTMKMFALLRRTFRFMATLFGILILTGLHFKKTGNLFSVFPTDTLTGICLSSNASRFVWHKNPVNGKPIWVISIALYCQII